MVADHMSAKFITALEKRQRKAEEWNAKLPTAVPPRRKRVRWAFRAFVKLPASFDQYATKEERSSYSSRRRILEAEWRARSGKKHGSIVWALNETFPGFWSAGELTIPNLTDM